MITESVRPVTLDRAVGTLFETRDLSKFKDSPRNRDIKKSKIKKIKRSIEEFGQLAPILVAPDLLVLEGQHRLIACRELGLPVRYLILEGVNPSDAMVQLNSTGTTWQAPDYYKHHMDKKPYQALRNLSQETGFAPKTLFILLKGYEMRDDDTLLYNTGKFQIFPEDLARLYSRLNMVREIVDINDGQFKAKLKKQRMMVALVALVTHPNYKHSHFLERLSSAMPYQIKSTNASEDAKRMLEEIYNRYLGKMNRVTL